MAYYPLRKGAGSIVPPFAPTDIANLGLWLDAADSSTITLNGSTVSQWNDKSSSLSQFVQASGALQPTYSSTGLNSKPSLVFSAHVLAPSSALSITVSTMFFVMAPASPVTAASTGQIITRMSGTSFVSLGITTGSLTNEIVTFNSQTGGYFSAWTAVASSLLATGHILTFTPNATSGASVQNIYIDGALDNNAGTGTYSVPSAVQFIGANTSAAGTPYAGAISEVIIYTSALTTAQRQQVEAYLANKWSIAV